MSKDEYVEFTGILPKELQKARKPIYGKIIKRSSSLITVKPRYKSYEVIVDKADLTIIDYDMFHKKHSKKRKAVKVKKKVVAKVTKVVKPKKNEGVVKAVSEAKSIKEPCVVMDNSVKELLVNTRLGDAIEKKPLPLTDAPLDKFAKKGDTGQYDWGVNPTSTCDKESESSRVFGNPIVWVIIATAIVIFVSYIIFF